ncbi:unnamed protein product [Clonostachys rhizophaga]|uniref:F-box domain-containing protein n=1 Tax=Clonostachys rhizophaga TaxID=160324 RepID=A0A9N9VIB8_9HYPO|nr:unnamed protein product [Clonostachys rhizophaga]
MGTHKRKRTRPRREKANISDAPDEIMDHIMSFVPRRGLVNLCLVNKSLRSYAEPFLYSTIALKWTENRPPPIINLLQTLLRRPELLALVQSYIPIIEDLRLPFTDLWVQKLRAAHVDAFAALLIAQAYNIRRLIIVDSFLRSSDFLAKLLRHGALGQPPKWRRLEQLAFFGPYVDQRSEVAQASFCLSTVTELAVSFGDLQVLHWPACEPRLDHLTSLDVDSNCATLMAGVLARTRCLKSLSWEWEYYPEAATVDFDEIIAALSHVKATLESLRLRMEFPHHWRLYDEPNLIASGSLRPLLDFDGITKLDVPLMALTGFGAEATSLVSSLPRNVEELSLSTGMVYQDVKWLRDKNLLWPDAGILNMIEESFRHYRTSLPRLRCIKINDTTNSCRSGEMETILEESSPVDGIDIEIVHDTSSPWRQHLDDL